MPRRRTPEVTGLLVGVVAALAAGCGRQAPPAKPVQVEPHVRLIRAEPRTIARAIGQPGFIYAYEQTSIYPKVAGYVDRWNVDIGDVIKKDQELARLYVPELTAELKQKKAQVELDEAQVQVAGQMVEVASAQVEEARATVKKYQASVERWESEVKRLTGLTGKQGVIDPQVLTESQKQLKADVAARGAAEASVVASKAAVEKARVDVKAARARAQVSRADEERVAALVGYTRVAAPYDGRVVDRNANQGDYVQPGTGDESGSGRGTRRPLYVVARTDKVRVYVDVPEMDARSVARDTPARVRIQALSDEEVQATVTRTSWSLRPESRTLRAEIDLPNPDARILPGMYAYGKVLIDRSSVRALPMNTVVEIGNQPCCYLYEGGKAVQTPVQTGIDDGKWVEVAKKRVKGEWVNFTGDEEVIVGDLSELTDGEPVQVAGPSR